MTAAEAVIDRDTAAAVIERDLLKARIRRCTGRVLRDRMMFGRPTAGRRHYAEAVLLQDRVSDLNAFLAGDIDTAELERRMLEKAGVGKTGVRG